VGRAAYQVLKQLRGWDVQRVETVCNVDLHTRIRDVRMGPEGAVYVLTGNGKLLKLTRNRFVQIEVRD
jgi:glucose/arabinose dehydrogenase